MATTLREGGRHVPRYRVTLTKEERQDLETLTHRGKTHARKFIHAAH